ncbi:MAG TPA: histidine phosphatase family protein [Chitinophagaceae bacterium]
MKFFIYAILFSSVLFFISCKSTNEIYIVRHAEKSTEPANDPHLTDEGKLRALALKDLLKDKNIQAVFSTATNRTVETATPLSSSISIPIQYYGNDTLPAFVQKIINGKKNALIVGHSNTVIFMINGLYLPHNITAIPDNDYDNMFVIKVKEGRAIKIIETTYGAGSPHVK